MPCSVAQFAGGGPQLRSAMSKQAHVERYVPADKDDGETRYFWKWNVGCPDQDNCSKRFAGIKSNFFSYEGEEAVREQLSNHLYSSTKHESVNTWPKAMEMVQDFENQSEEPAIVMEEETFEERDQYRKEYEEMLKLQDAKNAKMAKKANDAKKKGPGDDDAPIEGAQPKFRATVRPRSRSRAPARDASAKRTQRKRSRSRHNMPVAFAPEAAASVTDNLLAVRDLRDHKYGCNKLVKFLKDGAATAVAMPGGGKPRVTLRLRTTSAICESVVRIRNSSEQMAMIATHEKNVLDQNTSHLIDTIKRASSDV